MADTERAIQIYGVNIQQLIAGYMTSLGLVEKTSWDSNSLSSTWVKEDQNHLEYKATIKDNISFVLEVKIYDLSEIIECSECKFTMRRVDAEHCPNWVNTNEIWTCGLCTPSMSKEERQRIIANASIDMLK